MNKIYKTIVKRRKLVMLLFIIAAILSAIMKQMVAVNYDMTDYLPEGSPSTVAMDTMNKEYEGGIPNARVMIKNVTVKQALQYKEKLEAVDGVDQVTWMDDSMLDSTMPLDFVSSSTLNTYFRLNKGSDSVGSALMKLNISEDKRLTAVASIRQIVGYSNCLTGSAVSTAAATNSTVKEIKKISIISIIMVLLILAITTTSWIEPIIVIGVLGVAIIINGGTNLIFGEISFVTNAAGTVLQLAVSIDYAVFLLHRYTECRLSNPDKESAMVDALCKSTSSLLSSGLTTVIGFLALCLMKFQIGPDLGLALAKGVAWSLIISLCFLPGVIVSVDKIIAKTHHKRILPDATKFGRLVSNVMVPAACVLIILMIPSFIYSNNNTYYYGSSHIFASGTQVGDDQIEIEKTFGKMDTYAIMVPKGHTTKQTKLINELKSLPHVSDIQSATETIGSAIPYQIIPDAISDKLISDNYSRIAVTVKVDVEGDTAFNLVKTVRQTCHKYYGSKYYLAGEGVSTYDLKTTITDDLLKVNIVAIAAVLLILIIMFRSLLLPVILVACIETAVWINLAIPYIAGDTVFYFAYLIISSVQLGATIDYSILTTERYRENRVLLDKRAAIVETIRNITPSVLTSGTSMLIVGFLMGYLTTHQLLAQLGIFIGRGALCSLIIVLFALPGLLYIMDKFTAKNRKVQA